MAFAALSAGVSGLQAFTEGVGVIADNITNVNTVGFKESRSNFSTLVTETAAISSFSPGGVVSATSTLVSQQGLLQPSGSATDLAVDGNGFFVVRDAADPEDSINSSIVYTRAGSFTEDSEGFLRNTAGLALLGYPLSQAGEIPANPQDLNNLVPININTLNGLGEPTQNVSLRANLQASTPINSPTPAYVIGDLAAGTATVVPDFETNVQVFDSVGGAQTLTLSFIKSGPSTFEFEVFLADPTQADAGQAISGVAGSRGIVGAGTLAFNDDATIDIGNSDFFNVNAGTSALNTTNLLAGTGAPLTFLYDNTGPSTRANGSITFDFGDDATATGLSQFDSPSTLISSNADGAIFGNVAGVSISENGDVTALFDNGLSTTPFRLPIATFQNPDGLQRLQGNAYGISSVSGQQALQQPGQGGAGTVAPNALELSTVDLANEFSELIRIQRAFSASTRIITTSDEILAELNSI